MDMTSFMYFCLTMNVLVGIGLVFAIPFLKLPESCGLLFRLGLWVGGIGLFIQAERNYLYISGVELMSFKAPVWVTKDVGYWILLVALLMHLWSHSRRRNS